ncbi:MULTISPECIES: 2OG-Fe(II) oxygenase family protein [unclassified Streptomyces]|uniref:isopenicillin N synthase family dioxygenase n=1 Tax=unclassified Streptomyces TaxID=2593676 RepID=UPI002E80B5D9|nr:2OG-Fe(II) oxygenase family protein [Streptomyces sp. NBC_00589]WTI35708.1 isopenicillin N synthase family oxygenase [Streptomyces sp. NBC_00775]WUB30618.1 isopenicillin N synthase family oxygenase [Streptomyces sp. NBC_00589]
MTDITTRAVPHTTPRSTYGLAELDKETHMGGAGTETTAREIRRIDLSDFEARKAEITEELWAAATNIGFFQLVNHGIEQALVDEAFTNAEGFFALPEAHKARHGLKKGLNSGWESMTQVRPSVGTPDQKESYQVTRPHMEGLWPDDVLPEFRLRALDFETRCREVAMRVLSCFADKLGFAGDFFTRAHDPQSTHYQSTLRMLHYFAIPEDAEPDPNVWRAGAHTDFDCLTLLFQRDGQGGLQVCPGKEAEAQEWTPVVPSADAITCNIGDMLMRWSDDRLPSNFHRVKSPGPGEDRGARYSIAFFAQADRDVVIEGPDGRYPPITAEQYIQQRIAANFAR